MVRRVDRLYSVLIEDDDGYERAEDDSNYRDVPGNAARVVSGFTLQKIGDRVADPKTVLAWLLTSLGAPGFATALLVPIREAGSLLPQAVLGPFVRRFGLRSRVWSAGAVGQSLAVMAIGVSGLTLTGLPLAIAVLSALAVFALFRAVSSITAKDVIGKTIPLGDRGSVTGIAASIAGFVAIAAGLVIATTLEGAEPTALALIVAGSATMWVAAAAVFVTIDEEPSAEEEPDPASSLRESFRLLSENEPFRRFVIARSLLLVSALSPPFVVAMSASIDGSAISGVGPFVIATGVGGLVASPVWGRLADRSSRLVMAAASGGSSTVIIGFLILDQAGFEGASWLGPGTYLLLAVAHAGARMGRKTYVVDMADDEQRTRYVATSNSILGIVLLAAGGVTAVIAGLGPAWTLGVLAAVGLLGFAVALTMKEVEGAKG